MSFGTAPVDKIIHDNGFEKFKEELLKLLWGSKDITERWDTFKKEIKGFGPATMNELLCYVYPEDFMIWNRKALTAFNYLAIEDIPIYDYQCDGKKYIELCEIAKKIAHHFEDKGMKDVNLLTVDYFFWDELQIEAPIEKGKKTIEKDFTKDKEYFIHNEIRDKISDIGEWLGFTTSIERKIAEGSVVDVVWEASIGNLGRVIYIFEVQTKGNIDSLIVNLLKSLNNTAVQGVVAVSNEKQLKKIENHVQEVKELKDILKLWNYKEVLENHENLSLVNESINKLGLVPKGF